MAALISWIIGGIVILANGSSVPHRESGHTHAIALGRFEPRHTIYLDLFHLTVGWALQAPFYALIAGCFGYIIFYVGRRLVQKAK